MVGKELYIMGVGAHAFKVYHCAILSGFLVRAFVDKMSQPHNPVNGVEVIGDDELKALEEKKLLFIGVGNPEIRKELMDCYKKEGWIIPNILHPKSSVTPNVTLESGILVAANAVVESGTYVGDGAIIDIGALVDHDCKIAPYSHLRAGQICQPNTHWAG